MSVLAVLPSPAVAAWGCVLKIIFAGAAGDTVKGGLLKPWMPEAVAVRCHEPAVVTTRFLLLSKVARPLVSVEAVFVPVKVAPGRLSVTLEPGMRLLYWSLTCTMTVLRRSPAVTSIG